MCNCRRVAVHVTVVARGACCSFLLVSAACARGWLVIYIATIYLRAAVHVCDRADFHYCYITP